ncbi:MAG TPA: bacteriohopanetetrol glucosamine biosynthesis glycosyltransferase HpnI [Candidatus Lustribacter sp.]
MGFGRTLRRAGALTFALAALAALGYTSAAIAASARFGRREREQAEGRPPVTLLIPLRGAEPLLEENLRAFAEQDYPELQLVLGVAQADDAALPIARRVAEAFPDRRIDIDIGEATGARNPKLANVLSMMRLVRNTTLILADSDTRVDADYVRAVTAPLQSPEIGAVTCLFAGVPNDTFAAKLGAMFMNEQFIPSALVDRLFGPLRHCFGPTNAFRVAVLQSIGGFEALAPHLADDFMLGHFIAQRGWRVVISKYVIRTMVSDSTLADLWEHELRWHRTIRGLQPLGYAGMFLTFPVPLALFAFALAPRRIPAALLVAAVLARIALQRVAARALGVPPAALWLIPARDGFGLAVWARGLTGHNVRWRGAPLQMAAGDLLEEPATRS